MLMTSSSPLGFHRVSTAAESVRTDFFASLGVNGAGSRQTKSLLGSASEGACLPEELLLLRG